MFPGFCVATARTALLLMPWLSAPVPSGTLFLLIVRHYFSLLFFSESSSAHTVYRKCACGSGDWEGGRVMRRQKAASSDQAGVKVHLRQLTAKVKRALLRLSRQCRLNQHPSEDTSTTSSGSESVIIADCDTELLGK